MKAKRLELIKRICQYLNKNENLKIQKQNQLKNEDNIEKEEINKIVFNTEKK